MYYSYIIHIHTTACDIYTIRVYAISYTITSYPLTHTHPTLLPYAHIHIHIYTYTVSATSWT